MKTSNKLVLAVVAIILLSMVGYDLALRAEYRKGEYKNRFYGMKKLPALSGYTSIDNRAANFVSVNVEKGNNAVIWTPNNWKENFKVYKNGTTLVIEVLNDTLKNLKHFHNSTITIICPSVESIVTKPYKLPKSTDDDYDSDGTTTLRGFDQQNLMLNIGKQSQVILSANRIAQLQAKVGENLSQRSTLTITSDNQINVANINVLGRNRLHIDNPIINTKHFTISDSATVSASGQFLKQIQK